MMNRTTFFAYVRKAPFGGRLTTAQVEGMGAILDVWGAWFSVKGDKRWLAYMLATTFHETGATMQPVRETFASSDKQAIARLDNAWRKGQLKWVKTPYWRDGAFGRGLVQITHWTNYKRMGDILKIPLREKPQLALQMPIAINIMFEGMTRGASLRGDFTGVSLENYFNEATDDPVGARKIVNGKDKAKLIAGYHKNFLDAINAAFSTYIEDGRKDDYIAPDVKPEDAKPDDVPVARSRSIWAILASLIGAAGLTAGGGLDPWTVGAILAIIAAGGVLAWLIASGRLKIERKKR